jgi:hypothetical protein
MTEILATTFDEYALHEACFNSRGKPRLKIARSFFQDLTPETIPFLIEVFRCWQRFNEYLLIEKEHVETGEKQYKAMKCSKRGNDVYAVRTRKRLGFLKLHEDLTFFHPEDFDLKKVVKTRLLWVTLTWNTNLCSLRDAWSQCEYFYNLWITNLRNKYGRIAVFRSVQVFPGQEGKAFGYPHFHLVLLFQDHEFSVFPLMDDQGKLEYRIHEKEELDQQGKWHSWIDVKAINSMRGIYNYATKHYEHAQYGENDEALLNNAVCWLLKKKSFTISGSFRETYHDLIISLRNSKLVQMDLLGVEHPVWVCKLVGVYSFSDLAKHREFEDPPPWFFELSREEVTDLFEETLGFHAKTLF